MLYITNIYYIKVLMRNLFHIGHIWHNTHSKFLPFHELTQKYVNIITLPSFP